MNTQTNPIRKVTVSLPSDLVAFADQRAAQLKSNRSQVITQALAHIKKMEEENLAAEGYQFYGQESEEFATASAQATADAFNLSETTNDAG
jgi:metal-responsive CopG/Arc/MetJ family transcriptional regulator